MTIEEFAKQRWLSVYGAFVAAQVARQLDGSLFSQVSPSLLRHICRQAIELANAQEREMAVISQEDTARGS